MRNAEQNFWKLSLDRSLYVRGNTVEPLSNGCNQPVLILVFLALHGCPDFRSDLCS